MRTAVSTHVAEILRGAGPKVTVHPSIILHLPSTFLLRRENTFLKLLSLPMCTQGNWVRVRGLLIHCHSLVLPARILRLLATNHIFVEVSPDEFANNRLSSVLDTGKSIEELLARLAPDPRTERNELTTASPESKHVGTDGMASIIEHGYELLTGFSKTVHILMGFNSLDSVLKGSSYLTETLLDPELGHANEPNRTALNKALNIEGDFLESPDNRIRLARFGAAMNGLRNMSSADSILEGSPPEIPRGFSGHHLTSDYLTCRIRLGQPPRGLSGCRCWRRGWLAVVGARYASSASSFRRPGSRVCCRGCN